MNIFNVQKEDGLIKLLKTFNTIDDAVECLNSTNVSKELSNIGDTLLIRLVTEEEFKSVDKVYLNELQNVCKLKSVVILFMAKNFKSFKIFWKSKEIDFFLVLKPFEKNKETYDCKELYAFIMDFLLHSLCIKHLGVKSECNFNKKENEIDIKQLADKEDFNILKLTAELGEIKCVEILLNLNIFEDNPKDILNPQSRAQYEKHYQILLMFIKENFSYPLYMDFANYPDELKVFITTCEDLHDGIISKNLEKIKQILDQNPKKRHFYNKLNESALKVAMNKKLFNIYEILLAHNVSFGPHEQFSDIFSNLSENEKTILREIHFKHSKDLPENHMNVLMMNTQISHDDMEREGKEQLVLRAYRFLNKDPLINPILKVVAASKHFDIIFDFKRRSVEVLDPTTGPNTRGIFYTNGKICIGAKQLLDPSTEHETFGTLAHELCHYALNLTFRNFAKPYSKNDKDNKENFKKIVNFCKLNREKEEIINFVFNYEPNMYSAELIVRVVHLLALYHNQPEKLNQLRETFSILFAYYIDIVVPIMEKNIPRIKAKGDLKIKKKNEKIFNLRRNLVISIGLGMLIAFLVGMFFYSPNYVFDKLSTDDKETVKNAAVVYKNVTVKLSDLFSKNSTAYDKLSSFHISKMLDGMLLNFDDPKLFYLNEMVTLKWKSLPYNLKEKLLNSSLNFQGGIIKFKDLNDTFYDAFSILTSQQIINILNGDLIIFGKILTSEVHFFIERSFIPEIVSHLSYKYFYGYDYVHNHETENAHVVNRTINKTFENFYKEFSKQNISVQYEIIDKLEKNIYSRTRITNLNSYIFTFLFKNSSEIIEEAIKKRLLILSSEAGAGKTVSFEQISIEIKKKYPDKWVSYIDLKDYTKFYKKQGTLDNAESLLKNILDLSSQKNEFEMKLFENSFRNGRAYLIWNGFDEISPTYNEFIFNLIKFIKFNTNNIQMVCTRPLYSNDLSRPFDISSWQLVPLEGIIRDQFLAKYFISQNVSEENINKKIENVKKIIEKLIVKDIYYNFYTPLMLKLVAEIHEDKKLQDTKNIYQIFYHFIARKIEIWLQRNKASLDIAKKLILGNSLIKIFQKYALLNELNIYTGLTLGLKVNKLQIMRKQIPENLPYEEISSIGILYINGKNKFEFAHQTFSEFFVAQYFIENVYDVEYDVNTDEAELRLELFSALVKSYGYQQQLVIDFINNFLQIKNETGSFNPIISELLRTKFKNIFFRTLDTINSHVTKAFEFLFNFFKKDHDILIELLQIDEENTLYTSIFNPNNFALMLDPKEIKNNIRNLLNDEEFEKFINGKNQRGIILFGMYFYRIYGIFKSNEAYDYLIDLETKVDVWDYVYRLKQILNNEEQKQLFMTLICPKFYLLYDNLFNISNFWYYENLWDSFSGLLSIEEMQISLGNALIQYFEVYPAIKITHDFYLESLLKQAQKYLSSSQIYEMFLTRNILHEAHLYDKNFRTIWTFLTNHTDINERRKILLQDDFDDKNLHLYRVYDSDKNQMQNDYYGFYYDFTPFKIFHRSIISPMAVTFGDVLQIYHSHFNMTEMQNIILSQNEFLYYLIEMAHNSPEIFAFYLEIVFEGKEKVLIQFLDRKIKATSLTVFQFVDEFKGLSFSREKWYDNLKVFKDLYEKLSQNHI